MKPIQRTMKTTIITILTSTLLIIVGFTSTAKNSGQEPPLKKQTTCEKTFVIAPNFSAENESTVYFKPFPSDSTFIMACNQKEGIIANDNEDNKKTEAKEKVNQPIIGGFLGMILFEPNFLNTNQTTNPNKG